MPECTTSNSMHGWSKWRAPCSSINLLLLLLNTYIWGRLLDITMRKKMKATLRCFTQNTNWVGLLRSCHWYRVGNTEIRRWPLDTITRKREGCAPHTGRVGLWFDEDNVAPCLKWQAGPVSDANKFLRNQFRKSANVHANFIQTGYLRHLSQ